MEDIFVRDSSGIPVAIDALPKSFSYNGNGSIASVSVTDGVTTWVKSYTYASGKVTAISKWVRQ